MPRKRKTGGRRVKRKKQMGANKFTDFFTKTIPKAAKTVYEKGLKPVGKFIKDKKLASTVANLIPHPGAKAAGTILGAIGLGRKRAGRKKRRQRGGLNSLNGRLFLL